MSTPEAPPPCSTNTTMYQRSNRGIEEASTGEAHVLYHSVHDDGLHPVLGPTRCMILCSRFAAVTDWSLPTRCNVV